jgi:phenylpropionate dioxygenase-like ring-hydroxylating dioxygenase large terminal subunit
MNEPCVFYRTEDGTPVALEDRCPHRRLPLSMGKLVGDDVLQCTITACASTAPAPACACRART